MNTCGYQIVMFTKEPTSGSIVIRTCRYLTPLPSFELLVEVPLDKSGSFCW